MKNILFLFCTLFVLNVKAQYVTIPDPNFVAFLQTNYPSCMNGNQMDTICINFASSAHINVSGLGISDLSGIEYVNLETLTCENNNLSSLPNFHFQNSLFGLYCSNNQFTDLPDLSYLTALQQLECSNNELVNLPTLPINLQSLNCSYNQLSSLPPLPENLIVIICSHNNLTFLPPFTQEFIEELDFSYNQITFLPELPQVGQWFNASYNNISCFMSIPNAAEVNLSNNPINCLPNYVPGMDSTALAYPLCLENDNINNPNGCNPFKGITGSVFYDINNNCIFDNLENTNNNFLVKLYDSNDSLIRQTFSLSNSMYQFPEDLGTYKVEIDTLNQPFSIQCQSVDTTVILDTLNSLVDGVNFALTCKPGFDIGTKSILTNGWVFPGQNHDLKIVAGDLSQFYNFSCASDISGQVQISVSGPVTYQTNASGTLTPLVNGNTYTYDIADFGSTDIFSSFGLIFQTYITAQAGDQICVSVSVTPELGDNNPSNNLYEFCYNVVNSYDPNMKEVFPVTVAPGFDDYFTYTIHFQNTGTAPAFNIRLVDTLDANLDLETFQILNYSHYQTANVRDNVLTFHFPNIQLPDSTTNSEGSKGYVQYRIKPKANLGLGTQIKNTANIYFDYNAPIVTNTTVNEYVITNSLHENEQVSVKVYPNPFSSSTTVAFGQALTNADIHLYNVYGQEVRKISNFSGTKLSLQKENLTAGIYFLQIRNEEHSQKIKLIITE